MEKRYQVFVSSTFADLKEERQRVIQTLMEMDCIPSGMELFPAVDEDQFQFIKKVIDDCDYYLLIIGGRYGTTTDEGISYTEKEFDYAVEKGLKVISFVHSEPMELPVNKTDNDPARAARLNLFREKAMTSRLVKHWNTAEQLPGLVALSLPKTIKMYPAVGWVRADSIGSEELLRQINDLRIEKDALQQIVAEKQSRFVASPDIAGMNEKTVINGTSQHGYEKIGWQVHLSWQQLFIIIAPHLLTSVTDGQVSTKFAELLFAKTGISGYSPMLPDEDYQKLKIQFKALNLIDLTVSGDILKWSLTPQGERLMYEAGYVRSADPSGVN